MSYNENTGKWISPVARASFPVLVTPKPVGKNPKPDAVDKYQLTIVFDKKAQETKDYKDLRAAVAKAAADKWGEKGASGRPRKIKSPFLTTDDLRNKVPEGYTDDDTFLRLHSTVKPQVVEKVDGKLRTIPDGEIARKIYAGCNVIVAMDIYAWTNDEGGSGVSFGLGNVMFHSNNEPWGASQSDAADDFGVEQESAAPDFDSEDDDDFLG